MSDRKQVNIIIRVTAEMKKGLEQLARKDDRPVASYLRRMIADEIKKHESVHPDNH